LSEKEVECPCEESSRVTYALCQDLPTWYFDEPHVQSKHPVEYAELVDVDSPETARGAALGELSPGGRRH